MRCCIPSYRHAGPPKLVLYTTDGLSLFWLDVGYQARTLLFGRKPRSGSQGGAKLPQHEDANNATDSQAREETHARSDT